MEVANDECNCLQLPTANGWCSYWW